MDVVAIGEYLIDFTPLSFSQKGRPTYEQNPGGAPANVAVAAARQGASAALIASIGTDPLGDALLEELKQQGVSTEGIQRTGEAITTAALVALDRHGERSFFFCRKPGADTLLHEDGLNRPLISAAKTFHFGSLSLSAEPSCAATLAAVELAKQSGAMISFDPNWRASIWQSQAQGLSMIVQSMAHTDLLKLSEEELALLTGTQEPETGTAQLFEAYKNLKLIAVTLGPQGCFCRTRAECVTVPGYCARVVDTTGAGDAFWGSLLASVSQSGIPAGTALVQMLRRANATGALCTQGYGAMDALPTLSQVEALLAQE